MPTIISDAAKQSGVSAKMIRYYEGIGLLPQVDRTESNYRTYTESDIHTLRFIRRARDLGYSISDIKRLLSLWRDRGRASADVKRIALDHAESLRHKIASMEAMLRAVEHLADHCRGDHQPDCPIMDDLAVGPTAPGAGARARRGAHSRNAPQKGVHA
ncbi:MAG: Cu(I)-responsive transcriptional regulator [Acidiphilium sp. 37-67-22]|nr:MAG: Cu(I)-responsive transcriptional regulator [Acidiphilium sp. 20-67-58]OYV88017.1 MAG: Cu(I)-responsive transcriptional regulator [Acidiphilium sp. 21-68-69]OYW12766.1 MAG: Cu(I)-responsive transcriptional regulator [Acidiphilium sp. 37-67-22]